MNHDKNTVEVDSTRHTLQMYTRRKCTQSLHIITTNTHFTSVNSCSNCVYHIGNHTQVCAYCNVVMLNGNTRAAIYKLWRRLNDFRLAAWQLRSEQIMAAVAPPIVA